MGYTCFPPAEGLYDPSNEKDSCGIGFVVNIKNRKSHEIIRRGLDILLNLDHRGAVGADPKAGDGAGLLIQLPDRFLREECKTLGIDLPAEGKYGTGLLFLPPDDELRTLCEAAMEEATADEGQVFLGWRDVPTDPSCLGYSVAPDKPVIRQVFIACGSECTDQEAFERKLFVIRKRVHHVIWDREQVSREEARFYIPTLSSRTILYKGMVLAGNLPVFYKDVNDERVESALALVHQRFSTNTFPSWELAQPFRYLCHNGEINTLRGNINWMLARRHNMTSKLLGDDLEKLWPLIGDGNSDSATFDNALELLVAGGYSLAHAMMLMIPEAWDENPLMDQKRRAFYEYHAALMEPWDGPAAIAFTDGRQIGATLDRNGLRPARYVVTSDDEVIMASEVGVLPVPEEKIIKKWRLQPGKMLLIDLEEGRIVDDDELKAQLAEAKPYQQWLDQTQIRVRELPPEVPAMAPDPETLLDRQQAFGYTQEDVKFFLAPMATGAQDPVGSMGRDIPLAVLSDKSKVLFDYFKQCFAQVTNPPIDPIREQLVMSLVSLIGPRPNLLDLETGGRHKRLEVRSPILTNGDLERIRHIHEKVDNAFRTYTLDICYPADMGAVGMEAAVERVCAEAKEQVKQGYNIIVLSDRGIDADHVAIPSLLATAAVHHHLIREGLRTEVGIVVETGEARQVHDFCLLGGYGAEAINPYLAFETISAFLPEYGNGATEDDAHAKYLKALDKGILKVMSKMGISTFQSYCGAQIFDAVGLSSGFIEKYFTKTNTAIQGVGLEEIAEETVRRHRDAFGNVAIYRNALDVGGELAYRIRGEEHMWTPETISKLQHAVRAGDRDRFADYSKAMDEKVRKAMALRGLLEFKPAGTPIPLDEVEPASKIVKRFCTGAMSFGSISFEAHTTIAIAMNRLGGRSNTGEGGEESERFEPLPNGDSMRSAIKQVASGRFGVTAEYLANSDEMQIKMAQGAKPGEGGQLPGHKVDPTIAHVRHSTPGVGLISPPPHHDIYSIEDLKQLIFDLRNVNPKGRVSVKLVSEIGVGTVAAGVAKARADGVLISGFEGGTGASPLTSVMHAGSPWEIGLAETNQTLVRNDLRGRISVQTDGGFRTGRDVAMGFLLGADEIGFATAALISEGCIMMRKCHLNTCPTGIATQDSNLRKRFVGRPEDVVNFFMFIAEEVREIMASMGFRTVNEMIGRVDRLDTCEAIAHWKAHGLDLKPLLHYVEAPDTVARFKSQNQVTELDGAPDYELIKKAEPALEKGTPVKIDATVRNVNRTFGTMLSGEVAKRYGHKGLPEDTIHVSVTGTAGQSFGAWLAAGVTLDLEGDTNDYTGKGLSGGILIVRPPKDVPRIAEENIIIGNTVLYGAISGECYFRGVAGERFAVRNSGVWAVVEGVGDHGCEYMTGGVTVVLGPTGRNFAAGMSGGVAYVYDASGDFARRCNTEMVELQSVAEDEIIPDLMNRDYLVQNMLNDDALRLRWLIERHVRYTDSAVAHAIIDDWDTALTKFVKVMPSEYRRALQQIKTGSMRPRERAGQSPREA